MKKSICRIENKSVYQMPPFYTIIFCANFNLDISTKVERMMNRTLNLRRKLENLINTSGWLLETPQALFCGGVFCLFVKQDNNSVANLSDVEAAIRSLKDYLKFTDSSFSKLLFVVDDECNDFTVDEITAIFEKVLEGVDVEVVFCHV